jgi:hypothetical protein
MGVGVCVRECVGEECVCVQLFVFMCVGECVRVFLCACVGMCGRECGVCVCVGLCV